MHLSFLLCAKFRQQGSKIISFVLFQIESGWSTVSGMTASPPHNLFSFLAACLCLWHLLAAVDAQCDLTTTATAADPSTLNDTSATAADLTQSPTSPSFSRGINVSHYTIHFWTLLLNVCHLVDRNSFHANNNIMYLIYIWYTVCNVHCFKSI